MAGRMMTRTLYESHTLFRASPWLTILTDAARNIVVQGHRSSLRLSNKVNLSIHHGGLHVIRTLNPPKKHLL